MFDLSELLAFATARLLPEAAIRHRSLAMVALAGTALVFYGSPHLVSFRTRRRLLGAVRRWTQWEFWPAWLAYLPVAPYFVYLALRYRSLTLFTAANPGIVSGGLTGESKSAILQPLSARPDTVASYILLPAGESLAAHRARAEAFVEGYPVVLKPDVGERGQGVTIIRSPEQLHGHLYGNPGALILQRYVAGVEFGIFYYRYPGETQGKILSITSKTFPHVMGDGERCVLDLILADERAVCLERAYRSLAAKLDYVPAVGERVGLVEIGSHCRGAVFQDACGLRTEALEAAIDDIAKRHAGFFIGRFDIRAESNEALCAGHSFRVLELNGVGAEAAHIYDPAVSLLDAYGTLFRQWRIAFEIGAAQRAAGAEPMGVRDLAVLLWSRFRTK